jgi:hypothetical protein
VTREHSWPCDWCQATPAHKIIIEPAIYTLTGLSKREIVGYACKDHEHLGEGPAVTRLADNLRRRKDKTAIQLELDVGE